MLPKKILKQNWMVAADIPENTHFMMSEPILFFIHQWPTLGLGKHIRHYFTYFKGDFSQMYFLRREFDANAEELTKKMIANPTWALRWIDRVERYSDVFMARSRKLRATPLEQMTDQQLMKLFRWVLRYHCLSHGVGGSISWQADAEKERVTKAIWGALETHLKKIKADVSVADAFSLLTTPTEIDFIGREERDFLRVADRVYVESGARQLFRTRTVEQIKRALPVRFPSLNRLAVHHYLQYCWLDYQYKGPATPLETYLGRWQELLQGEKRPRELRHQLLKNKHTTITNQRQLVKEFWFPKRLQQLVRLGQRLVFIKAYRKEALYHGMYCYESLLREVGRRCGLTLEQVRAMNTWEIPDALLRGLFDTDELNARLQEAVAYADRQQYIVYTGKEAKRIMRSIRRERIKHGDGKQLTGTPACPGVVTGTVKVINVPSEMGKMQRGDIMVAHNTNPNLVSAMKKAAALVSEAGGLTCHTAIVSRELGIPSVVGVAGANSLLKDGDKVEVDATKGIIRKL